MEILGFELIGMEEGFATWRLECKMIPELFLWQVIWMLFADGGGGEGGWIVALLRSTCAHHISSEIWNDVAE